MSAVGPSLQQASGTRAPAGWGQLSPLCRPRVGGRVGSGPVLSSLCLSPQAFLMGTYAGGRRVMNEAKQPAQALPGPYALMS